MRFFKGEALNLLKQHQATTADLSFVVIIFKESQDISDSTNAVNKMAVYQKTKRLFMFFILFKRQELHSFTLVKVLTNFLCGSKSLAD